MANTFVPHEPEETVLVKITKREALVIQELRKFTFGKLTVHKANNVVVRVEPLSSKMIDVRQELTIPIVE